MMTLLIRAGFVDYITENCTRFFALIWARARLMDH